MIFVTVGAQMPFDRLVGAVDAWAEQNERSDIIAQIGRGGRRPRRLHWVESMGHHEFRRLIHEADLVVTHAGMGTMLTALEFARPIIVMPRQARLHETRNDHQFGTARAFALRGAVTAAWDERRLIELLDRKALPKAPEPIPSHAEPNLLTALRQFIERGEIAAAPDEAANPSSHQLKHFREQTPARRAA